MDFDVSTQSVRSALGDLQLKVRLLEDERDHFHHLFLTTGKAFDDHRRELTLLLQKERSLSTAAEERLRLDLQRTLAENTMLHSKLSEVRSESGTRIRTALEEFHAEQNLKEERLRVQLSGLHNELLALRRQSSAIREEKKTVEAEMSALLHQQSTLQHEVENLQSERNSLEEQVALDAAVAERVRRSPVRPCRTDSPSYSAAPDLATGRGRAKKKVFLPSGKVAADKFSRPSTHHLHAMVQTVEHQALLQPRPLDGGTRGGKQLDLVCRTIIGELLDLKREYAHLADRLGDPLVDSVEVSSRLRQLMYDIDRKTEQLRQLRRQQQRIDDDFRIHEMFKEIVRDQGLVEDMYDDLLRILRSTSAA